MKMVVVEICKINFLSVANNLVLLVKLKKKTCLKNALAESLLTHIMV